MPGRPAPRCREGRSRRCVRGVRSCAVRPPAAAGSAPRAPRPGRPAFGRPAAGTAVLHGAAAVEDPVVGEMSLAGAVLTDRGADRGEHVGAGGFGDHFPGRPAVQHTSGLMGDGTVDDVPERRGPHGVEVGAFGQQRSGVEVQQVSALAGRAGGEVLVVDHEFEPRRRAGQRGVRQGGGQVGQRPPGQGRVHDHRHVGVAAAVPVVAESEGADRDDAHQVGSAHGDRAVDELRQVGAELGGEGLRVHEGAGHGVSVAQSRVMGSVSPRRGSWGRCRPGRIAPVPCTHLDARV